MFLKEELLLKFRERAPKYDKENTFSYEDYEDLKKAGYLSAQVPKEYGGAGLSLKEIAHEQTRLAMYAPGTALGINMHQIIVGLANYMVRKGNDKGIQILKDAAAGKLLSFGISEPANDRVLFGSITDAKKQDDGSYIFNGPKVFISMSGEADKFVIYGNDSADKDNPKSVFAYVDNDEDHVIVDRNWDTLGMRATQSYNLELKDLKASKDEILTIIKPTDISDPVLLGIFANFEILLAATYHGIGKRALEVGIETVKKRKSVANNTTYSNDPLIRERIANAALMLNTIQPQIDRIADDFINDVDYGKWLLPSLSAIKNYSTETSYKVVEEMVRASGGSSYSNNKELSRLYRDVLAGLFQPSDMESLKNSWANTIFGPIEK
ncbi:acyl-CoA dehydrogenase family protein [uncultured Helcococcus sp.]|uniref:acyl-CoA dehydrogenase family protein n=1 Tax=uncultured Helcococcus sp. TaxID=1072508 RepID=UPI0026133543|nr:acyl-CoA dehydrogenase family protein [uncultured Helcococcus sp.]